MRDAAGQLTERLHLLRLRHLLARRIDRTLGLVLLGNIAHQLGKADKLPASSRTASSTMLA